MYDEDRKPNPSSEVTGKKLPEEEAIDTVQEKDTTGGQREKKANPCLQRLPAVLGLVAYII